MAFGPPPSEMMCSYDEKRVMNDKGIWVACTQFQLCMESAQATSHAHLPDLWPAPGSEDTELGVLMELEVGHGETEVYARVQA